MLLISFPHHAMRTLQILPCDFFPLRKKEQWNPVDICSPNTTLTTLLGHCRVSSGKAGQTFTLFVSPKTDGLRQHRHLLISMCKRKSHRTPEVSFVVVVVVFPNKSSTFSCELHGENAVLAKCSKNFQVPGI